MDAGVSLLHGLTTSLSPDFEPGPFFNKRTLIPNISSKQKVECKSIGNFLNCLNAADPDAQT